MSTRLPRPSRPAGVSAESLLPPRGAAPAPGAGSEMAAAGPGWGHDGAEAARAQPARCRRAAGSRLKVARWEREPRRRTKAAACSPACGASCRPGPRLTLRLTLRLNPQRTLQFALQPRPGPSCRLSSCSGQERGAVLTSKPCGVLMVSSQMNSTL